MKADLRAGLSEAKSDKNWEIRMFSRLCHQNRGYFADLADFGRGEGNREGAGKGNKEKSVGP